MSGWTTCGQEWLRDVATDDCCPVRRWEGDVPHCNPTAVPHSHESCVPQVEKILPSQGLERTIMPTAYMYTCKAIGD